MTGTPSTRAPMRVTDLIERHNHGSTVVCRTRFDILPVDFQY